MAREFLKRTPAAIVAKLLFAECGEVVAPRTIARRCAEFRASQMRIQAQREQMQALIAAQKSGDLTAEGMLHALAFQSLLEDPDLLGSLNLAHL